MVYYIRMDSAPSQLGRYRILEEIGRGGSGCVFKARDEELQRTVAIKVLDRAVEVIDRDRVRFMREARAAAALHHPRIVPVYDVGEESGKQFLVMEWVDGQSLHEALATEFLTRGEAIDVVRQAAEGVAFAHDHGILHRDLKPGNIMVTKRKEALVLDFGLALQHGSNESRITNTGVVLGTPSYMSPEQAQGRWDSVDERSDVWALGATLYHVLAGVPPFKGLTVDLTLDKVVRVDPLTPRRMDATIHPDVETVCMKALEKDPHRRYRFASDFAEDLRRYLSGNPIVARPPSLAYRLSKWARRRAGWIGGAAAAVVLATIVGVVLNARIREKNFRDAKARAETAHAAQDWRQALFECDRADRIRPDAALARIAGDCRERIALEEARRELRSLLHPLEQRMAETRLGFYAESIDLVPCLDRIRKTLDELDSILRDSRFARLPDGWLLLGIGAHFVGDDRRAEPALLRAEELGARDGPLYYTLGLIYIVRSTFHLLTHGDRVTPEQREAVKVWSRKALACFLQLPETWEAGELEREIAAVCRALAEERLDEVARRCDKALEQFAGMAGREGFLLLRAWVDPRNGARYFRDALQVRPHDAWARLLLACVRPPEERESAISDCSKAIRINPHSAETYFVRGQLMYAERKLAEAKDDFTRAIECAPDLYYVYVSRSAARHLLGDYVGAVADADAAIRLEPRSAIAFFSRAVARMALGNPEGALKDYTEALSIDPDYGSAYVNRGMLREAQGNDREAMGDYDSAVRVDPAGFTAYGHRGNLRRRLGDVPGAIADYTEALKRNPKSAITYFNRGSVRQQQNDLDEAIADYSGAIEADPNYYPAYLYRGAVRFLQNDRDRAAEDAGTALKLAPPDWPQRAAAEELLAKSRKKP